MLICVYYHLRREPSLTKLPMLILVIDDYLVREQPCARYSRTPRSIHNSLEAIK